MRRVTVGLALLLGAVSCASCGKQPETTEGTLSVPQTVTLTASADSWLDASKTTQNRGNGSSLHVRASSPVRRPVVQFDLSSLQPCVTVSSADLQLTATTTASSLRTYAALRLTELWKEGTGAKSSGVTWISRDGTTPWTTAGGTSVGVPTSTAAGGVVVHFDVTADLAKMVKGAVPNDGWLVEDAAEGSGNIELAFGSKESASAPRLVVAYTPCATTVDAGGGPPPAPADLAGGTPPADLSVPTPPGGGGGGAADGGVTIPPSGSNYGQIPTGTFPFPVWTPDIPKVPPSTTGATYYVDGAKGDDSHDGKSVVTALKTINAGLNKAVAGDTVLILGGLYRGNLNPSRSGSAGKPLTIGAYGDGEVILDGSNKVTWTRSSGNIWKSTLAFTPIGVVVNELVLKQVPQSAAPYNSTAPSNGLADVTSGSGKWYFDTATKTIYADMQTALGSGDPNSADVVVPASNHDVSLMTLWSISYLTLDGLTIRGSGGNGIYAALGSHNTIIHCNVKYNAYHGITFQGMGDTDNQVLLTQVYHNVLTNYPFGNGGNAEAGGGWPGALDWQGNLRAVARGNIVHMNGGEGLVSYVTKTGVPSGSSVFEQNVSYDNWSMNLYFDNQPNNIARNNFIFRHPMDLSDYISPGGTGYPYSDMEKFTACLTLADETYGDNNGGAALDHTQVYNNVFAGCRISISDYSEGTAAQTHALKNSLIANNTIVMATRPFTNRDSYGIKIQANGGRNANTVIQNNIVYGYGFGWTFAVTSDPDSSTTVATALNGVTVDNNVYYSTVAKPFLLQNNAGSNVTYAFTDWQKMTDTHSRFVDPQLVNPAGLHTAGSLPLDWSNAGLQSSSPALGTGVSQSSVFTNNFRLQTRTSWNIGAF